MAEVKKLKEENKVIQHEAANLLRQVIDVKADVKAIQEQRNKSVMFMAHFSTNQTNVRNDTALVFDKAELNVGHAYNKASGKFVAPMLGVYMFHSQIQGHNDGVVYVRMRKNGEDVAEIYTAKDDGKRDESGSTHALLLLGTGDEVWMQRAGDADSYYGNFRSHFTGYMLKAL
ncbi:complement C1q tumor necrosis factor-related protein 3-like [Gigantopelta aegis]|uniref:complement C1q tumor necrosis factor-related protein 3-like n=1 Tax=Gigantopelta aegis TaxID=1735272 RepID=UPI001B88BA5B|nr:complement C1q tumor necrosis factor-related protein 3-like [Gigantopelta aegis]